ncbi:MAG: tyrosine-type recombinase/integrase, partial [Chloroflexota bacterium]|nr:tyrosine-type recombinase/integrase [Chloroflexota bacterium]
SPPPEGPLFLGYDATRMTRDAAARMVRRIAKAAGITKRIGPHSLRHSFITAALDAGVHRGWKGDPLYDIRKLLLLGAKRVNDTGWARLPAFRRRPHRRAQRHMGRQGEGP